MTIDNDTQLAVYRTPAQILEDWRTDTPLDDAHAMGRAIADAALELNKAIRRGQWDTVAGISDRLDRYASKVKSIAGDIANGKQPATARSRR